MTWQVMGTLVLLRYRFRTMSPHGHPAPAPSYRPVGVLFRGWGQHRRLSQLVLAIPADIATRQLSEVENGRATPSPAVVLQLGQAL